MLMRASPLIGDNVISAHLQSDLSRLDCKGLLDSPSRISNAATIKRARLLDNGIELQPDSDDSTFHSMVFDWADADAPSVRVVGKVVWHCPPTS